MIETHNWLAEQFEAERPRLRGMAYRMLGSLSEAEDAVQETWLHLFRSDMSNILNLGGWLTTALGRVCLNMLQVRKSRREESLEEFVYAPIANREVGINPEEEAELADTVGLALLVVLDTLAPAERLAFVLHDIFCVPFNEIVPIVERSPMATRQLASRARRRVRGFEMMKDVDLATQRDVVDAFLAASREGSFDALLAVLDPDIVFRSDNVAVSRGAVREVFGAGAVARSARHLQKHAPFAQPMLIDGAVGIVIAPRGWFMLMLPTIKGGKVVAIDAIADPKRLQQLRLAVLSD
ncbi:sigma factor [Ktedonospora formicarum]|uniref:DNA-directed RNA polymerase sigma-70 factor n=1 Tax=Ktedonospora formicarum TaxID=2778364 RepID=A0A8J3HXP4_9CHLR|nr:sigma factor [Ktedonospora formicarum]GHO46097.1 DNA-directed RNA polymerase sigma-70 factor [Ktedonospora formicarum]